MSIVYRSPNTNDEFEKYFKFRWEILRKPLGLALGSEQDRFDTTAFHIAAFKNQNIIGVGRIQIENDKTSRIRYMAVDEKFRMQGVGSCMLNELEAISYNHSIQICWLYARDKAVKFYLKNNYEVNGIADSELEIPHQRMQKTLSPSLAL
ncbi:MAG: GNAT family N-acetyltransferase [Pseudomonadota bacterium]